MKLHPLLAFLADATSLKDVRNGIWNDACRRELEHQAHVTVKYATNIVTNVRRMRRTTFTDQMASLGTHA